MPDYIDRDALLEKRWDVPFETEDARFVQVVDVQDIMNAPAADVATVRHGRWIKRGYSCGENEYECSVCHETEWRTSASRMKYCMFCGAKMDGGESGGNESY